MDFKQVIEGRRSINFFDPDRDVPDNLLTEMVELAAKAPSGFNLQPWSLIVLRDLESKKKLEEKAWNQTKVSEAPVTLMVLADMDGWKLDSHFAAKNFEEMLKAGDMKEGQREWFANATSGLYGASEARTVAFAVKNTSFFAMALMLAAKSLGLETHPMDGFDIDGVRKAFNIPDNYWIPMLLSVGYMKPGLELRPAKWRKSYDEIVLRTE